MKGDLVFFLYDMELWIESLQFALLENHGHQLKLTMAEIPTNDLEDIQDYFEWIASLQEKIYLCREMMGDALEILA